MFKPEFFKPSSPSLDITNFISKLSFVDGCDNSYIFTQESENVIHFDYVGVTRTESSSGNYSGGPNQHKLITREQYQQVQEYYEKGKAAVSDHVQKRTMGSSMAKRTVNGEEEAYLLAMGGTFTGELWNFLKTFK
ncbi:hypothetical protein HMI54_012295 [Coelomomyces lativittatus]|nr:hypothetical protein HMI54_012295 [Coelomomyces lativittatus]